MPKSVRVTKVFSSEREIVVGVDGSEHSKRAVEWAIREAKLRGAVLRPVCVAPVGSDVDFDWSVDNSLDESQEIVDVYKRQSARSSFVNSDHPILSVR